MAETNNGHERYRLDYAAQIGANIVDLAHRAKKHGLWNEFRDAFQFIQERLQNDPLAFGDPFANLPVLGLRMMHRVVPPLHIVYGVDAIRKIVYLKSVSPFPVDLY